MQHVAKPGCVPLSVGRIPCCSSLYHFQSVNIYLGVWISNSTDIFDERPNSCEEDLLFYGDSSNVEVSSKKSNGFVCLVADILLSVKVTPRYLPDETLAMIWSCNLYSAFTGLLLLVTITGFEINSSK